MNRKTDKQFKEDVYYLVGNEYVFLEEYKLSSIKLKVKHNKCGHIYEVSPNSFLSGSKCPKCSLKNQNKVKGIEVFKEDVFYLVGTEYSVIGDYINSKTKIRIKHNTCGNEYMISPNAFLSGKKCPYCRKGRLKTTEEFKLEVEIKSMGEYELIGEYINTKTKTTMKHNKCGHIYEVAPKAFLQGNRCPNCFGKRKLTTEELELRFYDLLKDEYELISEYIDSKTKVKIKHIKCGHVLEIYPGNIKKNYKCPNCRFEKE